MKQPRSMPPDNYDNETLVAYLDGELPSEQATAIEQSLHADETLRERVRSLKATWELLDELPVERPRADLAQSTVEMVTMSLRKEPKSVWSRLLGNRWLWLFLGGIGVFLLGASTGRGLTNLKKSEFIKRLPAVVLYRVLDNVDSIDWLEQLSRIDDLKAAASYLERSGAASPAELIGGGIVPAEPSEREDWLEGLDDTDRAQLRECINDYVGASAERKQELQQIASAVLDDSDRPQGNLLETIQAYKTIMSAQSSRREREMNNLPVDDKLREVQRIVAYEMARAYAVQMAMQDRQVVDYWMDDQLSSLYSGSFGFFGNAPSAELVVIELNQAPEDSSIGQLETDSLVQGLTLHAQDLLARLESDADRRQMLGYWVLAVAHSTQFNRMVSSEELRAEFDSLDADEREQLELLPERKVHEELLRKLGVSESPADGR